MATYLDGLWHEHAAIINMWHRHCIACPKCSIGPSAKPFCTEYAAIEGEYAKTRDQYREIEKEREQWMH